ncbi:lactose transport system permease protein LacF [Comamonadaceae bacterium OS-4]|jgi:oligogalacturonide transport system permease protein|uniref:carbohydrate ABC transporter permease n=1 Tax=Rhodoferax TaxID=28065 RepID=UPI0023771C58|nr:MULTISPECIES: sugar ABC transporter permease [unclassified Rhodoferax]MDT7516759.1 sugar ABC transporter permease [Rhodoferax sp. TBRC 17199]MDT7523337.1 sugar ABC transporter permease [Rhodoferax sp. TBRC 17198]BDT73605.1 lactose transport system permease protein LacF [Comamonadaceae bacterium OS-4]
MYENKTTGFLFVLPFVIGVLGFKLFPFVMSFALSFTQYDFISPPQYIGLENYQELFQKDPLFQKSLGVTLLFAAVAVPMRVGFALFMAHVLNFKLRGINFFRSAYYLPSILGGSIAAAIMWRFIFSQNGLVNIVMMKMGLQPIAWLADEHYSLWTVVLLFTWQFGSAMVIFLAALQNVPTSLYEAAEIDGASKTQQFFKITVPLITPVIFFNLIMQMVHAFQEFNGPYMITEGGPLHSTYVLSLYIYDQSFKYFNLGYGSALSWVLFAIVAGLSAISFFTSKYWVFYSGEKERK